MKNTIVALKDRLMRMINNAPKLAAAIAVFIEGILCNTELVFAAGDAGLTSWTDANWKDFALWEGVWSGLKIFFLIFTAVGIFFVVLGIIQILATRFNGQELTQPLFFLGIGVVMVVLRLLLAESLCTFVIRQMYDKLTPEDATKVYKHFAGK